MMHDRIYNFKLEKTPWVASFIPNDQSIIIGTDDGSLQMVEISTQQIIFTYPQVHSGKKMNRIIKF